MYIVYPCKSVNVPCPNEEKYFFSMWIEKKRIFVVALICTGSSRSRNQEMLVEINTAMIKTVKALHYCVFKKLI